MVSLLIIKNTQIPLSIRQIDKTLTVRKYEEWERVHRTGIHKVPLREVVGVSVSQLEECLN